MAAISEESPMCAPSGAHKTVLYPAKLLGTWMRMLPLAVKFSWSLGLLAWRRSATWKIHPTRRLPLGACAGEGAGTAQGLMP
jgi:hypothetical protein